MANVICLPMYNELKELRACYKVYVGKQITLTFCFFTWPVMGKVNSTIRFSVPGFLCCSGVPGDAMCSWAFWNFWDGPGCSGVPGFLGCSDVNGFSTSQARLNKENF